MSVERRNFGKLPVSRDTFVAGTTYYKYNIVVNRGSSFMAATDGVTAEPIATYNATTHLFEVTAGWLLMSYGSDVVTMADQIAAKADTQDLLDGNIVPAMAEEAMEIHGNSSDRVHQQDSYLIRTTAGDLSIKSSEPARLRSIKGLLDDDCNPFTAIGFRFGRFNNLNPSLVISSATVNGTTIVSDSNSKIAYFKCVQTIYGSYMTDEENNGYLFTDSTGANLTPSVYWCENLPTLGSTVEGVITNSTSHSGYTHYLPSKVGYLVCVFGSTVDLTKVCAHVAWSEFDDVYELFVADMTSGTNRNYIDFSGPRDSIHNNIGLYGIYDQGRGVYDEIVFDDEITANRKWYRRLDRTKLKDLTWSVEERTSEQSGDTTYVFTATLTAIKMNGLFKTNFEGITLNENVLTYSSTTITTVESFKTALGDNYIYYELATEASGSHNISGTAVCNDMSTEEFVFSSGIIRPANVIVETDYVQGLRDYLRSLPDDIAMRDQVIAAALVNLDNNIKSLQDQMDNFGDAKAESMDVLHMYKIIGKDLVKRVAGTPTGYPDFIGQFWLDTTNKISYQAVGMTGNASNDWKRITNA